MCYYDESFINVFNEYYPFEHYIVVDPKPINDEGDVLLTGITVLETEIKPIFNDDGKIVSYTCVSIDDVIITLKCQGTEFRFKYYDFNEHIRENIRDIMIDDFGAQEYEYLYIIPPEEESIKLKNVLLKQKQLIEEKYCKCVVKNNLNKNIL